MSRKRSIDSEYDAPATPPTARYGPMHALVALGRADWTSYLAMLTEDVAACVLSPYLTTAGGTRCWPGVVRDQRARSGDAEAVLPASAEPEKRAVSLPSGDGRVQTWSVRIEPDNTSVAVGEPMKPGDTWIEIGMNSVPVPGPIAQTADASLMCGEMHVYCEHQDRYYSLIPSVGIMEVIPPAVVYESPRFSSSRRGLPHHLRADGVRVHAMCVDGVGQVCVAYRRDGTDTDSCILVMEFSKLYNQYFPIISMARHTGGQICAMAVDAMGDLVVLYGERGARVADAVYSLGVVRIGGQWAAASV